MAENRKDNDGLFYASKIQLVAVAAGFTLTCVLVFLLGILIGQGIEERKLLKQEEPLVKVPLPQLAPGSKQGSSGKDDLTFYDTLAKTPSGSQPPSEPSKESKTAEKTSKPAKESAKEAQEAKASAKETKSAKAIATDETQAPGKAAPARPAEESKTETASQERTWTVQVNAFPEEARAQKLVERLKEKGYDAYLVKANINGKDWHRVRVGHFTSRSQGKELLQELQTKENFTKAMVVSR